MRLKQTALMSLISVFCACVFPFTSYAIGWEQKDGGWTYSNEDGTVPVNEWKWIDNNGDSFARHYYFDSNSMLVTDGLAPDRGLVNEKGEELEGFLTPRYWRIRQSNPNPEDVIDLNTWYGTYSYDKGKAFINISSVMVLKEEPLRPRCSVTFTSEESHPIGRRLFGFFNDTNTEITCIGFMPKETDPSERVVITRDADGNMTMKTVKETTYMSFVDGKYNKLHYFD